MCVSPLIDARKAARELARLRLVSAHLNRKLFEQCCQLQSDVNSVDFELLSRLTERARVAERRKRLLERVLDLQAEFASGIGQNQ